MNALDAAQSSDVVAGTLSVNTTSAKVLIDRVLLDLSYLNVLLIS